MGLYKLTAKFLDGHNLIFWHQSMIQKLEKIFFAFKSKHQLYICHCDFSSGLLVGEAIVSSLYMKFQFHIHTKVL